MARSAWVRSSVVLVALAAVAQDKRDPAGWGGDHVGKPVPEFVHGDECLFCHRNDIGPGWQQNAHGLTNRQREDAPGLFAMLRSSTGADYSLGSRTHVRYLRKSGYGKFDISSFRADLDKERKPHWQGLDNPAWQRGKFEDRCAGCHTTGVDPKTKAFSAPGLDCYTCHGVVDLDHTNDTSKIFLSKKRRSDVLAITSTCASCHLRGGKSKSTGLPYPNNFVPGDNLFKDYQVDWSAADDATMNPGDRHVWINVRDVAVNGGDTTCLSCHAVHANSTNKHRRVLTSPICLECHNSQGPKKAVKTYTVQSPLCEY